MNVELREPPRRIDGPRQPRPAPRPGRKQRRRRIAAIWLTGLALAPMAGAVAAAMAGLPAWALAAGAGTGWIAIMHRRMHRPGATPILTYHSISDDADWLPWRAETSVSSATFDRHLATLKGMGCTCLDTREFIRRRQAGEPVPSNAVILHFDDGYLDNRVAAAPLLRRHGMRGTLFISLDFIEPDQPPRPAIDCDDGRPLQWDGYLTWREIRELDRSPEFDVQPHGVDHARVPVGPEVVDTVSPANWRRLAWLQWSATPGSKHAWHRRSRPSAVPFGTPVPASDGAFAALAWLGTRHEDQAEFEARIRRDLTACRAVFLDELGKQPTIFCWPENLTSPDARRIAAEEGYLATTGGSGENRACGDTAILSRVHVGDRSLGFRWTWFEGIALRATVRCFQGNLYWYPLLAGIHLARRVVTAGRRGRAR